MLTGRRLTRAEVSQVWAIDRSEVVERIYHLVDGALALRPDYCDIHGWPPGEAERYTPSLLDCFDRGGWFYGLFEREALVALAVLESKFIGAGQDTLQLKFLHVSHAYRRQGLGRQLFELARARAGELGARWMYVSATPSENTIDFYRRRGCRLARQPDPELYALEPDDIHLECVVESAAPSAAIWQAPPTAL